MFLGLKYCPQIINSVLRFSFIIRYIVIERGFNSLPYSEFEYLIIVFAPNL